MAIRIGTIGVPKLGRITMPISAETWRQVKKNIWSYAFLLPMLTLVGLFVVYPMVASIHITLTTGMA